MDMREFMQDYVEKVLREQWDRMEQEAKQFLAMGYLPDELTIVCLPDGYQEISPKSALT